MPSVQEVEVAPLIELPNLVKRKDTGVVLEVVEIGVAWLRTVDGKLWRIPEELEPWARDASRLLEQNSLPCWVEFGRLGGRAYAEFLT